MSADRVTPPVPASVPVSEAERILRATLSALGPGSPTTAKAVFDHGLAGALGALDEMLRAKGSRAPTLADGAEELARGDRLGVRFIVPGDPDWPERLVDLETPDFLHDRGMGGCFGLWVRSEAALAELVGRSVGIVGTRTPTSCGIHVATELGHGLADVGWSTVSGAAYGIDASAHRGSLVGGAPTVAVVAGGVDKLYPAANSGLLDRMAAEGAIVSEVPPGRAPTRSRFLIRNRLIAALSVGTVLVEAGVRSGARNTVAHARALSRLVMVVPGQVTSPMSAGSNLELRHPETIAVMSAADVLETVAKIGEHQQPDVPTIPAVRDGLSVFEAEVLDAVPVRTARPLASIARAADHKPVLQVAAAMATLMSLGLVHRSEEGYSLSDKARGR